MALARLELVREVAWLLLVRVTAVNFRPLFLCLPALRRVPFCVVPRRRLLARFSLRRRGALGLLGPPLPLLPLTFLFALPKVFLDPLLLLLFGVQQVVERLAEAGAGDDLGDHSASPLSAIRTP